MNWTPVPLGELLIRSEESVNIVPTERYNEVTVRLWGKGVVLRGEVQGQEIASAKRVPLRAGQFILSRIDARNGALGIVPDTLDGAVVSNDFPTYNIVETRLFTPFLGWISRTRPFVDLCRAASEGTTNRVRLQEERFLRMAISLPPLPEQRRIVAKVGELAAKIEEARGLRGLADEQVVHLPASASAVLLGDAHWPTKPLEGLLREDSRNGLGTRPNDSPPGLPILRISAGTSRPDGVVDESDHKFLELSDKDAKVYALQPGDLLACRFNGNLHFVGRFSLYLGSSGRQQVYPDKLIRFRVNDGQVLPAFVRYAMNSPKTRGVVKSLCATTAGNIGISATALKRTPVPVPPIDQQRRIVAYLDALQAKVDCLKAMQTQTAAELDALLPAILDKAFKGGL